MSSTGLVDEASVMNRISLKRMVASFVVSATISGVSVTQSMAAVCEGEFTRPAYKTRSYYCAPGQMVQDDYDVGRKIPCEEMEVDHLISLRQAWGSGVCGEDLKRLANDPRNLKFTHWRINRAKGYLSPEDFARTRPRQISAVIIQDAEVVMREYRIKSRDQTIANRMLHYSTKGTKYTRIPISSVNAAILKKITYRQVGGKTVAYLGKRAIGYAVGVGIGIEAIMVAGWAVDWLTSPSQDERMKERAVFLRAVLEGNE